MQHLRIAMLHLREQRYLLSRPSLMLTGCNVQAIILPGNLIYIGFSIVGVKRTLPPTRRCARTSANHRLLRSVRELGACSVSDHPHHRCQAQTACSPDMPTHLTRSLNSRRSLSDRMFESAFEMGSFEPSRFLQPPPHGGAEAWKAQQVSSAVALGSCAAPRRSLIHRRCRYGRCRRTRRSCSPRSSRWAATRTRQG